MIPVKSEYKQTKLYFDEPTHKYTDDCGNSYISATTIIHSYVPKFDSNYWAKYKAKEEKYEMEWHGLDKLLLYGSYVHRHRSAY